MDFRPTRFAAGTRHNQAESLLIIFAAGEIQMPIVCRPSLLRVFCIALLMVAGAGSDAFAQRPSQAQINAMRQSCRSDYMAHCSSVPTGGAPALNCLKQNLANLSPGCQTAVKAITPESPPATTSTASPSQAAPAAPAPSMSTPSVSAPRAPAPAASPAATSTAECCRRRQAQPGATQKRSAVLRRRVQGPLLRDFTGRLGLDCLSEAQHHDLVGNVQAGIE